MSAEATPAPAVEDSTSQLGVEGLVLNQFRHREMRVLEAIDYKKSLLGTTTKLVLGLPNGEKEVYFLKIITMGAVGALMCEGEFESLKALHEIAPGLAPKPVSWGQMAEQGKDVYFLLEEFRDLGEDLTGADALASGLAGIHLRSRSPTGKFGFHVKTCHGPIVQQVDQWEDCWATFYKRHLRQYMDIASPLMASEEFDELCWLILDQVVPKLLLPLQENGRVLKPALIHGDCWDGNTASDRQTGEAIFFDACSFYGHNEYDIGNWRAPRHRVSAAAYREAYKEYFPMSEPVEDWDARNVLYSLSFNMGNIVNIPNSDQREAVIQDMKWLCANSLI